MLRCRSTLVAMMTLLAASCAASASDMTIDRRGQGQAAQQQGYWGDQRGCYWRRGERFCSRYCYWEVDGRRYCQDRERLAHPQGDPWFVPYPPEPPIYLRPPHARP